MSGALLLQRGPLAQQPQYPAPVDTSTPLARGLVGAFHPAAGNGSPVSGAYLNVAGAGRGFATSSASQYWSASSNAIVSSSPTWTILTVLTGTPTAAGSGGMAFYCERPNGTQIVKLGFGDAAGTTAADFVVRDLSSNIVFLRSSANVQTNTGPRVLVGVRRASNDHRLFVNGLLSGSDTSTNVNGAFGASASVIGNDLQDTTSYLNGASVPLVLLWNRALSDAEIAAVSANPWQIFKAPRPRLWLAAASSSSAVLVGANSTQANSGGTGAVTQTQILAGATSSQANTSGTGAESQTHVLAGSTSSQANASGTGAAGQTHVLAGAASSQANNSATGAVSQTQILAGAASSQANTGGTGAETQTHVLAGSTSSQANSGTAGAIVQVQTLIAAASTQSNTSGTGALVSAGMLQSAASSQANSGGTGAIGQTHVLAGASATQANVSGTGGETQTHILAGAPSSQANNSGTGAIIDGAIPLPAPVAPANVWVIDRESRVFAIPAENRTWSITA